MTGGVLGFFRLLTSEGRVVVNFLSELSYFSEQTLGQEGQPSTIPRESPPGRLASGMSLRSECLC